jgi:error-prone DNA polymerase
MRIVDGPKLVLLVTDLEAYAALCRLITVARRRAGKGEYRLLREDLHELPDGCWPCGFLMIRR